MRINRLCHPAETGSSPAGAIGQSTSGYCPGAVPSTSPSVATSGRGIVTCPTAYTVSGRSQRTQTGTVCACGAKNTA